MKKQQFFGRNIGQKIRLNDKLQRIQILSLENIAYILKCYSDCQIIGRRISQMTRIEDETFRGIGINGYEDNHGRAGIAFRQVDYLDSIGVFPDEYFDKGWCVEEKK